MEARVFLDSSYAIALAADSDQYHVKAVALSEELEVAQTRMVTTRAVLLEIGNALARSRYRKAAIELLSSLESDSGVEIIPLSEELYAAGLAFYSNRPDKAWGLVDCISFVVMTAQGMREALTSDEHFAQAGFLALLR